MPVNPVIIKWEKAFRAFLSSGYETLEEYAQSVNLKPEQLNELRRRAEEFKSAGNEVARKALEKEERNIAARLAREAAQKAAAEEIKRRAEKAAAQKAWEEAHRKAAQQAGKAVVKAGARRAGAALVKLVVGATGIISLLLAAWTLYEIYQAVRPSPGPSAIPTPCPPPVYERRKCPWTPEGYGVEPCGPGFCWDGGPQGSLACKQEESVPNSGRTYTTDLVCNEGYVAERDPCTNEILRCVKQ